MRDFLRKAHLPLEPVECPEWAPELPTVWVKTFTARELVAWQEACRDGEGQWIAEDADARLVAHAAADANGVRLFGDTDIAALAGQPGSVIMRLSEAAARLNRLRESDREALRKNSAPANGTPCTLSPPGTDAPSGNCSTQLAAAS